MRTPIDKDKEISKLNNEVSSLRKQLIQIKQHDPYHPATPI